MAMKKYTPENKGVKKTVQNVVSTVNNSAINLTNSVSKNENKTISKDDKFYKPVSEQELTEIRDILVSNYADLVMEAFSDEGSRERLKKIIIKESNKIKVKEKDEIAEYIVSEIIGLGFVEKILQDKKVTDIGWNGTFCTVLSNDEFQIYTKEDLHLEDPEVDIFRIVKKFADAVGKPFNRSFPILDSVAGNLRLSATHNSLSPDGTTMSLRSVKPRLALQENNFEDFAPMFVFDFLKNAMKTLSNVIIAGETGSGKTELLKLMLSLVNEQDRIIMIEEVRETHIKELLPNHDIFSWITNESVKIIDEVVTSLRNFPKIISVAETRGPESYEMLQATLTDHKVITTIHSSSARGIVRRMVTTAGMDYTINEETVKNDILEQFDFGIHIKTIKIPLDETGKRFKLVRYLSEIVEYDPFEKTGAVTLFKQKYSFGEFFVTTGTLSEGFKERMSEKYMTFDFPKMTNEKIPKSVELEEAMRKATEIYESKSTSNAE